MLFLEKVGLKTLIKLSVWWISLLAPITLGAMLKTKLTIALILWLLVAAYTAYDAHKKKEPEVQDARFEVVVKKTI